LDGRCSPREEREVLRWLDQPEGKDMFNLILEEYFENPKPKRDDKTDYQELLNQIHSKVLRPARKKSANSRIHLIGNLRIAASILLLLFSGYMLIEGFRYKDKNNLAETKPEIQTISRVTGIGEKLTLRMPDKTLITVNSQSEISFTSDYGKDDRVVTLKGEAYFEISADSLRPFKVISNGITTTALGTAFNVLAQEGQFKIALTEGKVSVNKADHEVILAPGQMAIWKSKNPPQKDFSIEEFDPEETLSWKSGVLVFDREPLGKILNDLAVWYGVEMNIDKGIEKKRKIIGTFANKNLKDILRGLSFTAGFNYEIQGKNVHIINPDPNIKE